ncbi:YfcL family protein [Alteromonas sediminis]|uniref:YfcL family protein n=1 Tax=Alteromonas sediminis TaxID=2259342 RepID=A0A3N5YK21_9ALTE|nr:YfcL family protein [Alteromonas sediminis]
MAAFEAHVLAIEADLDGVVDTGTDDDLFIASYLQGHVAVVAKPMEVQPDANLIKLDQAIMRSLEEAFDNNELDVVDQEKVIALWQSLLSKRQLNK